MKKIVFLLSICLLVASGVSAQKKRTILIDKNGKFTKTKEFAVYILKLKRDKKNNRWYKARGTYNNGEKYLEGWYRDIDIKIPEGEQSKWFQSGQLMSVVNFSNGKYDGTFRTFYENGSPHQAYSYDEGVLDGDYSDWYPNANKQTEYNYTDGKKNGKCKLWYENGQPMEEVIYFKDSREGESIYYHTTGKRAEFGSFQNDQKEGFWTEFWTDGKEKAHGNFEKGMKEGVWRFTKRDGSIDGDEYYFRDNPIGDASVEKDALARVGVFDPEKGRAKILYGLIDRDGKEIVPTKYDWVGDVIDGAVQLGKDGKFAILKFSGAAVVPFVFDGMGTFNKGLIKVKKGKKWGYINKSGETIIDFKYDQACNFSNRGMAQVRRRGRSYLIDTNGNVKEKLPRDYDVDCAEDMPALVRKLNKFGEQLLTDRGNPFTLFMEKSKGFYGVVDEFRNSVVPFEYTNIHSYWNGMVQVWREGKKGFFNDHGQLAVPLIYDYAEEFYIRDEVRK